MSDTPPPSHNVDASASPQRHRAVPRWLTHVVAPLLCAATAGSLTLFGGVTALASCGIGDPLSASLRGDASQGASAWGDAAGTVVREGGSDTSVLDLSGVSSLRLSYAVRDALEPLAQQWGDQLSVSFVALNADTASGLVDGNEALPTGSVSLNGDVAIPSASMIKLAILACLLDESAQGHVDLDTTLELTPDDVVGGSGTLQHAEPGTTYTLEELAYRMIAESDNVATNMIIGVLGKDAINAEAARLGLSHTELHHTMMDTTGTDPENNCTSADDVARILAMVATGLLVNADSSALAQDFLEAQTVDMGLDAGVPDGVVVAHKTGTIEGAIHDGGIVYASGQTYVLSIMTQGLDYAEATSLIEHVSSTVYAAVEDMA